MLKIWGRKTSVNVQKVMWCVAELGLAHERIEAGGSVSLEWGVKPARRGEAIVELTATGSLFPFGFLQKSLGSDLRQTALVWPAQVEYEWTGAVAAHSGAQGRRTARAGTGDDLLECKNFGVTSLNEVREKLTIQGLKLRGD